MMSCDSRIGTELEMKEKTQTGSEPSWLELSQ